MKLLKLLLTSVLLTLPFTATAGDFDWAVSFNLNSKSSPSLFLDKMSVRFGTDNSSLKLVLKSTNNHADAYIIFRLAEISNRPISSVLQVYQSHKGKGWGVMAKQLGIKPGSPAFKSLKDSQDLYAGSKGKPGKKKK